MYISNITSTVITDGVSVSKTVSFSNEGIIKESVTSTQINTPAEGTLSTRTSDTAGTITDSGHSISDGEIIDIYWADGAAYGATVGTTTASEIPFTLAAGDVLPTASTTVTYSKQVDIDVSFDGDEMDVITQTFSQEGMATFYDSGGNVLLNATITSTNPYQWYDGTSTRPITGNPVDKVSITNKTTAGNYNLVVLKNSV